MRRTLFCPFDDKHTTLFYSTTVGISCLTFEIPRSILECSDLRIFPIYLTSLKSKVLCIGPESRQSCFFVQKNQSAVCIHRIYIVTFGTLLNLACRTIIHMLFHFFYLDKSILGGT